MLAFTTEQTQAIWEYMMRSEWTTRPSDITDDNIKAVEAVVMDSPGFWLDMSATSFRNATPDVLKVEYTVAYTVAYAIAVATFWASAWKYARLHGVL